MAGHSYSERYSLLIHGVLIAVPLIHEQYIEIWATCLSDLLTRILGFTLTIICKEKSEWPPNLGAEAVGR